MMEHSLQWNVDAFWFLPPEFQLGMTAGAIALILMIPAAVTSFDSLQKSLGKRWRQIHLLAIPALLSSAMHTVMIGSHYLGNKLTTILLGIITLGVLLVRTKFFWSILSLEKFYVSVSKPNQEGSPNEKIS
jgi:DMSO/TMAO reductase YedYZ heme-binding membrane subunit